MHFLDATPLLSPTRWEGFQEATTLPHDGENDILKTVPLAFSIAERAHTFLDQSSAAWLVIASFQLSPLTVRYKLLVALTVFTFSLSH
jgi:hypothetical protein